MNGSGIPNLPLLSAADLLPATVGNMERRGGEDLSTSPLAACRTDVGKGVHLAETATTTNDSDVVGVPLDVISHLNHHEEEDGVQPKTSTWLCSLSSFVVTLSFLGCKQPKRTMEEANNSPSIALHDPHLNVTHHVAVRSMSTPSSSDATTAQEAHCSSFHVAKSILDNGMRYYPAD
jgi:hypothetical protein